MDSLSRTHITVIAKGSFITLGGTSLGILLQLALRPILARGLGAAKYGEFVVGYTVVGLIAVFVTLGMGRTLTRFLPFFEAQQQTGKLKGLVKFAGFFGLAASLAASAFLFCFAADIAACFSGQQHLASILRIFAVGLPFLVMTSLTLGALRGFKNIRHLIFIQNLLTPASELVIAVAVLFIFHLNLEFLATGYVICFAVSLVVGVILLRGSSELFGRWSTIKSENDCREILTFSLPLAGSDLLGEFRYRADSVFLGYMMSVTEVGLYNVCIPVARALQLALSSINKIFMPSVSELYGRKNMEQVQHIYGRVSLWVFYASLPMFLVICSFPELILKILFGPKFMSSSGVLLILACGFFINAISGPFGETFVAAGRPQMNMHTSIISLTSNIGLMVVLIPRYGLTGAAIAASASLICACLFGAGMLYYCLKLHPFRKEHLKSLLGIGLPFLALALIFSRVSPGWQPWLFPFFALTVYFSSLAGLLFSGCLDENELNIFESILSHLPGNLNRHVLRLSRIR